jgi:Dolichyl-phosphate-mannose-protein mannosyltransferase
MSEGRRTDAVPTWALVTTGVLAIVALTVHLPGQNGPWYHKWPWQSLPAGRVYAMLLLAGVPSGLALWAFEGKRLPTSWVLSLLAGGTLLLLLTGAMAQTDELRLTRIAEAVHHREVTSYLVDAMALSHEPGWLASFPERMGSLNPHSRNKPPGGILFYSLLLHLFQRPWTAAALGGLLIGLLATLGVPATFFFARSLGASEAAAVYAAACLGLTPSLVLFFPELDQLYPALTALMLGAWVLAVRRPSLSWAAVCGLTLGLATLFSFSFLVLGVFFVGYAADRVLRRLTTPRAALRAAFVTLAVFVLCDLLLWAATGYRQPATFASAVHNESLLELEVKPRPYLPSLVFEPLDFMLGMGYLPVLLALFQVTRRKQGEFARAASLAVAQIGIVALTSLLDEAARVWLLLAPLLMPAAGAQLERLGPKRRWLVLGALLLITASVARNLEFITL